MKKIFIIMLLSFSFAASAQNFLNITNKDDKGNKLLWFIYQNNTLVKYSKIQISNNGTVLQTFLPKEVSSITITQSYSKNILEINTSTDTKVGILLQIPIENIYYVDCEPGTKSDGQDGIITIVIH